jgi:hypothetical protein
MQDCIVLARTLGERVGSELGIPVFLYERAATRPDRTNLADIRRGEFEQARDEIGTNPNRVPDFGPNKIHPTAGATVIGARPFLVAYNVYLGGKEHLGIAKSVAKAVRGSSGGLKGVKGLGLEVDGQAQVSMNLVDLDATPLHRAYEMVKMEAEALGVTPTWSEIVGLVPERALFEAAARHLRWKDYTPDFVLERKVRAAASRAASRWRVHRRCRQLGARPRRRIGGRIGGLTGRRARADGLRPHRRPQEVRGRGRRDEGARPPRQRTRASPQGAQGRGRRGVHAGEQRVQAPKDTPEQETARTRPFRPV